MINSGEIRNHWLDAASELNRQGKAYVLVTVIGVKGSTPRDGGTKMVVSDDGHFDTIGGGHLEFKCIAKAQQMLVDKQQGQYLENFQLAAKLGQCCGGETSVLFEYFAATSVNIVLFGAGHVGQALVNVLVDLPCRVTWVDSRESQFPPPVFLRSLSNITTVVTDCPDEVIEQAEDNSYFIVMTHNHQLDFDICQSILRRKPFKYLGLIASKTKWRRFKQRFAHRDIDSELVEKMSCPIGLANVPGKKPSEIAISIASEIISIYQGVNEKPQRDAEMKGPVMVSDEDKVNNLFGNKVTKAPSVPWRELKLLLS